MKNYPQGLVALNASSTENNTAAEQVLMNSVRVGNLSNYWSAATVDTQQFIQVHVDN